MFVAPKTLTQSAQGITFRLMPDGLGLSQFLGPLEAEIMRVVWSHGSRMKISAVHDQVVLRRSVIYTTVKVTMDRLAAKGLLTRSGSCGHGYWYEATCTEESFVE
jgi:predicted transcriptional regulator